MREFNNAALEMDLGVEHQTLRVVSHPMNLKQSIFPERHIPLRQIVGTCATITTFHYYILVLSLEFRLHFFLYVYSTSIWMAINLNVHASINVNANS